jgi:hypothetical protein
LDVLSGRSSIYEIINREEIKRKIEGLEQEYKYNSDLRKEIIEQISKNSEIWEKMRQNPKDMDKLNEKLSFTSHKLRFSSLELLITTRYIDENIELYQSLENSVNIIYSINETITEWLRIPEHIEKWLIKAKKVHDKQMEQYKKSIDYLTKKYIMD